MSATKDTKPSVLRLRSQRLGASYPQEQIIDLLVIYHITH